MKRLLLPLVLIVVTVSITIAYLQNFTDATSDPQTWFYVFLLQWIFLSFANFCLLVFFPVSFSNFHLFFSSSGSRRSAALYAYRGMRYLRKRDNERALKDFSSAIDLKPNFNLMYRQRGTAYLRLGKYQEALSDFEQAIRLKPKAAIGYTNRAAAWFRLGEHQRSIQDYSRSIQLRPRRLRTYIQRAMVFGQVGAFQEALADNNFVIKLAPNSAVGYHFRALTHLLMKNPEPAIEDLSLAASRSKRLARAYGTNSWVPSLHAGALCARGHLALRQGAYQVALEDCQLALKLVPGYSLAYRVRGAVYLHLGNLQQAREAIQQACEDSKPFVSDAFQLLWLDLEERGPDVSQIVRLEELAVRAPETCAGFLCQGLAFWLRGESSQAEAELERAARLEPQDCDAYFWLGFLYVAERRDVDALVALREAFALGLPVVLAAPLKSFEQERPDFYAQSLAPLMEAAASKVH